MATQQEIKEIVSALKDTLRDSKYGYSEENIGVLVKQIENALKNTDSKDIEKIFKEIIPREDIWDKVQEISDARRIDRKEVVQESKAKTKSTVKSDAEIAAMIKRAEDYGQDFTENILPELESMSRAGEIPPSSKYYYGDNIETPDEILKDNKRFSQYDDVDMKLSSEQNVPSNTPKLTNGVINPADKHNLEYIVKNLKNIPNQADRKAWVGKQPQYIQDLANKYKMSYIADNMNLGKTIDKPITEATNVSPENVNNAKVVRKPLTSDFELGIPNYGKKIPDNTVKVWNLGRKIFEQDIDQTKKIDGKPAVSGWEPNLIGTGHQEGILIDKALMEAEWLNYGKEVPKPGERIVHGFDGNARRNIKNLKGGIEWNYGIATEVIEVEELAGDWFNDIEMRNKIARQISY